MSKRQKMRILKISVCIFSSALFVLCSIMAILLLMLPTSGEHFRVLPFQEWEFRTQKIEVVYDGPKGTKPKVVNNGYLIKRGPFEWWKPPK